MHMMYGYGSVWTMVLMIVFWAGLISFGVFLVIKFKNSGNKNNPLDYLKVRLARGEIDGLEYERLKSIIENDRK